MTSAGDSKSKKVTDPIGQGSVSSLNISCAIEYTFENTSSKNIGNLNLNLFCT